MSKKVVLSGLLVLALFIVACAGQVPAGNPPPVAPTTAGQATAAPAPTSAAEMTPQKGGAITVAYKDDLATLDPAIGYDWTNWPAEKLVFDGLLDYDAGTTIQPRLAESLPQVNADATVYTFKLRK
ncbi:MAG TPA: hypothetical protein VFD70_30715, partial [Anaerolineae bacterium]|nr:hypothetical protein [Anaerolineae bacterium]